jgi:hypothetical protein
MTTVTIADTSDGPTDQKVGGSIPSRRTFVHVTEALYILCIVVVTALAFDFTNGFHDTANAMATSVAPARSNPKWRWPCRRS